MEEFAKTRAGKKFLELDLPNLITSLNKLSESINQKNAIEEKRLVIEQKRYLKETKNARTTGSIENSFDAE
jgi:hypothetical protein